MLETIQMLCNRMDRFSYFLYSRVLNCSTKEHMLMLHTTWMHLTDTIFQTQKKTYRMRACRMEQVKPGIMLTNGYNGYLRI